MKDKKLYIMPECYVDTNMIEYLVKSGVNHQHSCTKVVGLLNNRKDAFGIGIIDKDKVELGYIKDCVTVAETEHLALMKHESRHQYLITVKPAIDKFILDCAMELNVSPETYDLPSGLKDFTKVSKAVTSNNDTRFKGLFEAIKDNNEIKTLRKVLKYLSEQQYKADTEQLKNLF